MGRSGNQQQHGRQGTDPAAYHLYPRYFVRLQGFNLVLTQMGADVGAPAQASLITAIPGIVLDIVCFIYGSLGDFVSPEEARGGGPDHPVHWLDLRRVHHQGSQAVRHPGFLQKHSINELEPITCIAPVRVDAVDTTGCGDSFMGTVLAGLASGFTLREAASLASYVSAYAATGYGAQASYGTAAQIGERFAAIAAK